MQITFDVQADAMYVYFTRLSPGRVAKTIQDQALTFELDSAHQIISILLSKSEDRLIGSRLEHVVRHQNVFFDPKRRQLKLSFITLAEVKQTVRWVGSVDYDSKGQMVGIEILFGPKFTAQHKLRHITRFMAPLDS
jgi:uncharacterized protein YuzE